jgi:hypothetical protein
MKPRYREAAWLLFLFLLAWAPRALALDAYVSPDERKWLARSANFAYALSHGDFAQTFQREHPGVTVMWAGTLGLLGEYPTLSAGGAGLFHLGTGKSRSVAEGQHRPHAARFAGRGPALDRLRRGADAVAEHLPAAPADRAQRRPSRLHLHGARPLRRGDVAPASPGRLCRQLHLSGLRLLSGLALHWVCAGATWRSPAW